MSEFNLKTATRIDLGQKFIDYTGLQPFNDTIWFGRAYETIQRTLSKGFVPLSETQKTNCSELLAHSIPALGTYSFDTKLRRLIQETTEHFPITIGHAQKLISIIIKHAFAHYLVGQDGLPPSWQRFIMDTERQLPVPIDTIVLYSLKVNYPSDFIDVWAKRRVDNKGKYAFDAQVLVGNKDWVRWSRISDFDCYWSLQTRIRMLAIAQNVSPLEFEMRFLWTL